MNLSLESKQVIKKFRNAADCSDNYLMMRVFKKCYDYSLENPILLMPREDSYFLKDKIY